MPPTCFDSAWKTALLFFFKSGDPKTTPQSNKLNSVWETHSSPTSEQSVCPTLILWQYLACEILLSYIYQNWEVGGKEEENKEISTFQILATTLHEEVAHGKCGAVYKH